MLKGFELFISYIIIYLKKKVYLLIASIKKKIYILKIYCLKQKKFYILYLLDNA